MVGKQNGEIYKAGKVNEKVFKKIEGLRSQGLSWNEIAKTVNLSIPTVRKGYLEWKKRGVSKKEEQGGKKMATEATGKKELSAKIDVRVDPTTFKVASDLVNAQVAENTSDAVRKGLQVLYAQTFPEKVFGKKDSKILTDNITNKKGLREIIDYKRDLLEMKQLDKALTEGTTEEEGDGLDINKLFQWKLLQSLIAQPQNNGNNQIQALQQQIKEMQLNFQQQLKDLLLTSQHKRELEEQEKRFNEKMEFLKEALKQATTSKGFDTEKFLALMNDQRERELKLLTDARQKEEQIKAQKDQALAQTNAQIEQLRNQLHQQQLEFFKNEIQKLREDMQKELGETSMTKQMRQKVDNVLMKHFERALTSQEGQKSTGQLATDLITTTIDKIKEPVLAPLGQALAKKAMQTPPNIPPEQTQLKFGNIEKK